MTPETTAAPVPATRRHVATTGGHGHLDGATSTDDLRVRSSAARDDTGRIYIGANDNRVYAFEATGTTRWTFETGDVVRSIPLSKHVSSTSAASTEASTP